LTAFKIVWRVDEEEEDDEELDDDDDHFLHQETQKQDPSLITQENTY
jgi:hypothetical protein